MRSNFPTYPHLIQIHPHVTQIQKTTDSTLSIAQHTSLYYIKKSGRSPRQNAVLFFLLDNLGRKLAWKWETYTYTCENCQFRIWTPDSGTKWGGTAKKSRNSYSLKKKFCKKALDQFLNPKRHIPKFRGRFWYIICGRSIGKISRNNSVKGAPFSKNQGLHRGSH